VIGQHCDKLCQVAMNGSAEELQIAMDMVSEKVMISGFTIL